MSQCKSLLPDISITAAMSSFLAVAMVATVLADTTFNCTYRESMSKEGVVRDYRAAKFILDTGRRKAYLDQGKSVKEVQYYISARDTLVTFVEVTPEKTVHVTTVDARQASTRAESDTLFYGSCKVK